METIRSSGTLLRYAFAVVLFCAGALALCAAIGVDTTQQAPFPEIFIVNSTGDGDDAFPGDGQCETAVGNGVCTLRAAIEEANAHAGGDGIGFSIPASQQYCDATTGACTIYPTKALPNISDSVNINGPGADKLNVQNVISLFQIFNVTTSGTVNISSLTIGSPIAGQGASAGTGIQNSNSGTVNVSNCRFINNAVSNSSNNTVAGGAGIYNNSGTVQVTSSTFSFNRADSALESRGAGIYNKTGAVTVVNSTFNNNNADVGGGIFNENGVVNVIGSTFHDNGAFNSGGGISSYAGTLNVTNSTFYANIAYSRRSSGAFGVGGGIANFNPATLNLTNSTVSANSSGAVGSGVFNNGTANVKSTIIALNYGGVDIFGGFGGVSPDVSGAFISQGFNLIGKKDGSTGFTAATDKKGTIASPLNPKLDPRGLRDNGGPTQTIALVAGSPAIDKGTSNGLTGTLTADQRGFSRTVDNSSIPNPPGGDGTDIGAFEFGAH